MVGLQVKQRATLSPASHCCQHSSSHYCFLLEAVYSIILHLGKYNVNQTWDIRISKQTVFVDLNFCEILVFLVFWLISYCTKIKVYHTLLILKLVSQSLSDMWKACLQEYIRHKQIFCLCFSCFKSPVIVEAHQLYHEQPMNRIRKHSNLIKQTGKYKLAQLEMIKCVLW